MTTAKTLLDLIVKEGEGQKIEFKEGLSSLAPAMVAFANSAGGTIFLGVADDGNLIDLKITNKLKSQITDIARNCDPQIKIKLKELHPHVLEIIVLEGTDKPYKCKDGFFVRIGPNTQKMSRDEIVEMVRYGGKVRFDETFNEDYKYPHDFNTDAWENFISLTEYPRHASPINVLANIGVVSAQGGHDLFSNAAVLFFAKTPQTFFPEARITCLKYRGNTRAEIVDKRDIGGTILEQLDSALVFFDKYNAKQIKITGNARHEEWEDYPKTAIREILINALIHRDYFYDSTHIYMHIYDNRIEVDNPGGLLKGMGPDELGQRAVRRNRMLADLMQRAGYIENAGTGISRIKETLNKNNNPPPQFTVTNFFTVTMSIRPKNLTIDTLTDRQRTLYSFIAETGKVSKTDCQKILNVSSDTTLNEIKLLLKLDLVRVEGKGKNTRYFVG